MSTRAKTALVPKLRFPEFRESEKWEIKPFQKLFSIGSGKDYKHLSSGNFPVYGSGGYMLSVDDFLYDGDSVCIGRKGTINKPMFLTGKFWTVDTLFYTHSFQQCLPKFVFSVFQNIDWLKHNEAGGIPSLSKTIIEKIQVAVPQLPEQQEIAACLSSLDELIAAQARKVATLKTHKKGLIQQLFPRDGETQPRLRFPEFQDAGDWVTEPLGQLASYENGKAYEQDITESGKYVVVNSRFISTDGAIRKYTNAEYLIANVGEVLMVLSDLPKGKALAKCYFVDEHDRYAVNQRVCRLKPIRIDGKFLFFILNRHPSLLAYDDGLNQTHLSKGSVTECPLCVPPTIEEQHSIANFLTSFDDLITAVAQEFETLKIHKKGLMQQLFPSMAEVV